jgi:hypothetical protein
VRPWQAGRCGRQVAGPPDGLQGVADLIGLDGAVAALIGVGRLEEAEHQPVQVPLQWVKHAPVTAADADHRGEVANAGRHAIRHRGQAHVGEDRSHGASLAGKRDPLQFPDRAVSTVAGHQVAGPNTNVSASGLIGHGGGDPAVVGMQRGEHVAATHRDVIVSEPFGQ